MSCPSERGFAFVIVDALQFALMIAVPGFEAGILIYLPPVEFLDTWSSKSLRFSGGHLLIVTFGSTSTRQWFLELRSPVVGKFKRFGIGHCLSPFSN
jgi:hypothetical protein